MALGMNVQERIIARMSVVKAGYRTPCWISDRSQNGDGYTKMTIDGCLRATHRVSYEAFVGPIPEWAVLDHLCRNRACCNPFHLEAVTHRENQMRGETVAAENARKTHCLRGHELSGENLIPSNLKQGRRACLKCARNRGKKGAGDGLAG